MDISEISTVSVVRNHTQNIKASSVSYSNIHVVKPTNSHQKPDLPLPIHCLNTRSVKNKAMSVADLVISRYIDVLTLTETSLGPVIDNQVLSELVPTGYDLQLIDR